jgi:hypothetical protein
MAEVLPAVLYELYDQRYMKKSQTQVQLEADLSNITERLGVVESSQVSGLTGYATQAMLFADLAHGDGVLAMVTNDTTAANNGTYRKTGANGAGSWVQMSNDRVTEVENRATGVEGRTTVIETKTAGIFITEAVINGVSYAYLIADAAGNAAAGVTADGRFVAFTHPGLTSPDVVYLDADIEGFAWALLDGNNNVAFGIRDDGSVFSSTTEVGSAGIGLPQYSGVAHIIHMGQSLGVGMQSLPLITTTDTGHGNLRFALGVQTWTNTVPPSGRPPAQFEIVPLTANIGVMATDQGETIANGMADHLKETLVGRYAPAKTSSALPAFLVSCAGDGGRYIRELDKRHDDAKDSRAGARQSNGGYYATSIDDVIRAQAYADALGLDYSVAAVTWMQGEANNDCCVNRWDAALSQADAIATYQADLVNLVSDYNADIRAITGQTNPIPFFTYQTLGPVSSVAQLQAAIAERNIYMVGPTYQLPTAINSQYDPGHVHGASIHISADGERWLGEQFGKVIRRVCSENQDWSPLRPLSSWIDSGRTHVYIRFHVPAGSLVLDTDFFPAQGTNKGFYVVGSSGNATISAVDVATPDTVCITLATALPSGAAYARYAQSTYVADVSKTVLAVRTGAAYANGEASTEVVFAGDIRSEFAKLANEGVFNLQQVSPLTNLPIRDVSLDGDGNTVCRGETRELRLAVNFSSGATCQVYRYYPFGNLRDGDNELSTFQFAAGLRAGQSYPLWNWCIQFDNFTITQ